MLEPKYPIYLPLFRSGSNSLVFFPHEPCDDRRNYFFLLFLLVRRLRNLRQKTKTSSIIMVRSTGQKSIALQSE